MPALSGKVSGSKIRSVPGMPYFLRRDVVDAVRDAELPVGVAGLAFFVDREADDRGAVLAREREHAVHALALALALFEVGRVEQRLAAVVLEAGFEHGGLGGVEHERERRLRREALGDLVHVDRCRRGRRSRRTRRARARLPSPAHVPSARTCPSRLRASRRGTCASRSRSCARRRPGTRAPGGTERGCRSTSSRARTRACARRARGRCRCARPRPSGARASCRSNRRRC